MAKFLLAALVALVNVGLKPLVTSAQTPSEQIATPPTPVVVDSVPFVEPCGPPLEKVICKRKIHLVEEQCATTLPALKIREYEACRDKKIDLEITWNESRQTCTELVIKPREIEQDVCCTDVRPVTKIDPCTGCPCTVYESFPVTKRVKVTVYEAGPEQRDYIVRTPCLKPVETEVIVKKLAADAITIPAIQKKLRAIETKCEIRIPVPPPPPCRH
jgi:hypothetical protein